MTLISALKDYFQTELNDNANEVTVDLGYLFERDISGAFYNVVVNEDTLEHDKTYYVPAMLQFKGDFNKPLNYEKSNQLAKGGTVILWFSLPDKNVKKAEYKNEFANVIKTVEEFENKFTGYRTSGILPTIESNGLTYSLDIVSSPLVDNGSIIKHSAQYRTLVTLSLSVKLGYNIAYGGDVRTFIKRYGADDSTYVEIESSNVVSGLNSSTIQGQEEGEKHAYAGIQSVGTTFGFNFYYPKGTAYTSDANAKPLLLELFKRIVDKSYNPSKKYTVKEIYPDFEAVTHWLYTGGVPVKTKGVELSASVTFAPLR